MPHAEPLVEILRGDLQESLHRGHIVVTDDAGTIVHSVGDPGHVFYPRSSSKMIQALPLMESGAGAGLSTTRLALACASHSAERRHLDEVGAWLSDLGLDETALACGPQPSRDEALAEDMIRRGEPVTRLFNWCSGKHAGFLQLAGHLGAGSDYVDPAHPVQTAIKSAFEDVTGEASPCFGIDGCSAPNHACTVHGLARAMAFFAGADARSDARSRAATALRDAMIAHPGMVGGNNRADTEMMQAVSEPAAIKSGAEGVYVAILPRRKLGVAIKIEDGAGRAAEIAMAATLVRLGALDATHPTAVRLLARPILNWDGLRVGLERPLAGLLR